MKKITINTITQFGMVILCIYFAACSNQKIVPKVEQSVQEQAWSRIRAGALLIDVRSATEFATGHLDRAANIPHNQMQTRASELGSDKNREIVLYCRSGRRSALAKTTLENLGFKNVMNAGTYQAMLAAK